MRHSLLTLACLLVACAVLAAPAPISREKELLGTTWSQKVNPDGDCHFVADKDALIIEIPGKDHDLWPKDKRMNAPHLLKEVEGDFDLQVRVEVAPVVSEKSTAVKRAAFVAAGLILIPTDRNVIRHEFGFSREWGDLKAYVGAHNLFKTGGAGRVFRTEGGNAWPLPAKFSKVWLKLERRGNELHPFASADGKEWGAVNPHGTPMPARVKVGVVAFSTSSKPFKARFDQWKLTPIPAKDKKRD
jgi:regulation of enolase protein 1 (concanavalin A-like superfamily)